MVYPTEKIKAAFAQVLPTLNNFNIHVCKSLEDFSSIVDKLDCAVVIGGDGSILAVSSFASKANVPVIGLRYGNLGFLSDVNPENQSEIISVLQGEYYSETRDMIKIEVNELESVALNELAINRKGSHLLKYNISIDDEHMCSQKSDGVLVHTATGSTAYSLSAGGQIIHPKASVFGIVPLNPHRLNTRPIILSSEHVIKINLESHAECLISRDGKAFPIHEVSEITIQKSNNKLTLLHPKTYDYFARLRTKLHWEN